MRWVTATFEFVAEYIEKHILSISNFTQIIDSLRFV